MPGAGCVARAGRLEARRSRFASLIAPPFACVVRPDDVGAPAALAVRMAEHFRSLKNRRAPLRQSTGQPALRKGKGFRFPGVPAPSRTAPDRRPTGYPRSATCQTFTPAGAADRRISGFEHLRKPGTVSGVPRPGWAEGKVRSVSISNPGLKNGKRAVKGRRRELQRGDEGFGTETGWDLLPLSFRKTGQPGGARPRDLFPSPSSS